MHFQYFNLKDKMKRLEIPQKLAYEKNYARNFCREFIKNLLLEKPKKKHVNQENVIQITIK